MANEKRKRSANWMASEKSLLVDIVIEHFQVIENKRTDGVSMKQKLAEWVTISNKYNSQTMLSHRTADNLKARWESFKKSVKKEASFRRMHLIQTVTDTVADQGGHKYSTDSATNIENCLLNGNKIPVELALTPANNSPQKQTSNDYIMDWGGYTPNKLKTPISKPLQTTMKENKRPTASKRLEWMTKRRPQLSNPSIEKLNDLKTQMEHAVSEREEAKKLFELQMDIHREILKQEKIKGRDWCIVVVADLSDSVVKELPHGAESCSSGSSRGSASPCCLNILCNTAVATIIVRDLFSLVRSPMANTGNRLFQIP